MIQSKPPQPWWVKIADFGITRRAENVTTNTHKGTESFMRKLEGLVIQFRYRLIILSTIEQLPNGLVFSMRVMRNHRL